MALLSATAKQPQIRPRFDAQRERPLFLAPSSCILLLVSSHNLVDHGRRHSKKVSNNVSGGGGFQRVADVGETIISKLPNNANEVMNTSGCGTGNFCPRCKAAGYSAVAR